MSFPIKTWLAVLETQGRDQRVGSTVPETEETGKGNKQEERECEFSSQAFDLCFSVNWSMSGMSSHTLLPHPASRQTTASGSWYYREGGTVTFWSALSSRSHSFHQLLCYPQSHLRNLKENLAWKSRVALTRWAPTWKVAHGHRLRDYGKTKTGKSVCIWMFVNVKTNLTVSQVWETQRIKIRCSHGALVQQTSVGALAASWLNQWGAMVKGQTHNHYRCVFVNMFFCPIVTLISE